MSILYWLAAVPCDRLLVPADLQFSIQSALFFCLFYQISFCMFEPCQAYHFFNPLLQTTFLRLLLLSHLLKLSFLIFLCIYWAIYLRLLKQFSMNLKEILNLNKAFFSVNELQVQVVQCCFPLTLSHFPKAITHQLCSWPS